MQGKAWEDSKVVKLLLPWSWGALYIITYHGSMATQGAVKQEKSGKDLRRQEEPQQR